MSIAVQMLFSSMKSYLSALSHNSLTNAVSFKTSFPILVLFMVFPLSSSVQSEILVHLDFTIVQGVICGSTLVELTAHRHLSFPSSFVDDDVICSV